MHQARLSTGVLWIAAALMAGNSWAQKIYTCVDGQGRRITSDRPILECMDREQRELNRSGTVRRVIPPSQTLEEKARADTARKATERAQQRQTEERQRDRALVLRYPNPEAHERARSAALAQMDMVMDGLRERENSLLDRLTSIDQQLAAHANTPDKVPPALQRQRLDTEAELAQQRRLLQQQRAERDRVNRRFDSERQRLNGLWIPPSAN